MYDNDLDPGKDQDCNACGNKNKQPKWKIWKQPNYDDLWKKIRSKELNVNMDN